MQEGEKDNFLMTTETRGALPICVEVPLVINAANSIRGFKHLNLEMQQSILLFAQAFRNYFKDASDDNRDTFLETLKKVHKGDGIRAIAFKVGLRVVAEEGRFVTSE